MSNIIGAVSYGSGEQEIFADPKAFIQTLQKELPYRSSTGFAFQVMAADSATRKAVDDLVYNEYGESNPHELAYYQSTEDEHLEKAAEALNIALYKKMFAEQETYRDWLLNQSPEEILRHTYEYTVREDILMTLENNDLSVEQASVLLQSPSPLGDVYQEFEHRETNYMDIVLDSVTERANIVLRREVEEKRQLLELPVYPHSPVYAREHGELELYRQSRNANIACRNAIEAAISEHYRDNHLGKEAAAQVAEKFGYARTFIVLANTVQHMNHDGRISGDNKNWAMQMPVPEGRNSVGNDSSIDYIIGSSHPGLIDLFLSQLREQYEQQPSNIRNYVPDKEKLSVRAKLQQAPAKQQAPKPVKELPSKKRETER